MLPLISWGQQIIVSDLLQGLAEGQNFPPDVLVQAAEFALVHVTASETKNAQMWEYSDLRFLLRPIFIFHIVKNSWRLV